MNGYDVDGVLTAGIVPEPPFVVISGRTLAEGKPDIPGAEGIYMRGEYRHDPAYGDRREAGEFKAEKINELGVTKFWEDDPYQANIILELCPDCTVVLVGP